MAGPRRLVWRGSGGNVFEINLADPRYTSKASSFIRSHLGKTCHSFRFSLGLALRPVRFMVLMCLCVCLFACPTPYILSWWMSYSSNIPSSVGAKGMDIKDLVDIVILRYDHWPQFFFENVLSLGKWSIFYHILISIFVFKCFQTSKFH